MLCLFLDFEKSINIWGTHITKEETRYVAKMAQGEPFEAICEVFSCVEKINLNWYIRKNLTLEPLKNNSG